MANIPPIKSIEDIYIFTRGGTVLDVQKGVKISSTTTTSGGSGYVHPTYGGNISTPSTTTTTTSREFMTVFVREAEGSECSAEFTDSCVAVRAGNRVSVVHAGNKCVNVGYVAALVNHDSGKQGVITEVSKWLVNRPTGGEGCGLFIAAMVLGPLVGVLLGLGLSSLLGEGVIMPLGVVITLAAFFLLFRPYMKRGRKAHMLETEVVRRVYAEVNRLTA